ncbi:MAG: hypothetical protein GY928_04830, partial [Colwellia sp.]|nr:hypothetical protein [Colwellia sp.]
MPWSGAGGGGAASEFIKGAVDTYALLPDATTVSDQLWFVKNSDRVIFPKYPRGFYWSDGTDWELTPIKVKWSEDAGSLLNWIDWSTWFSSGSDIALGDRVVFNNIMYRNTTGTQTATPPNTDTTNWSVAGVETSNSTSELFLNGDATTEGSRRFALNGNTGFAEIEKLVSGVWQPASLMTGSGSLWVGMRVGIAAAGRHIMTEDTDGSYHFHGHSKFDGKVSQSDARILDAYAHETRTIIQPDNSGTVTTNSWGFTYTNTRHNLLSAMYYQTDTTAPTTPVRFRIWRGTDDTGILNFDQTYPVSDFSASSEIILKTVGYLEFLKGVTYFGRFDCDTNFSLKLNAAGTLPWLADDVSRVHEDDLLQTAQWVTGDTYTAGQLSVQNRQVYKCNTTGVQTGTFASNIALWDNIATEDNLWSRAGTTLSPKTAGDQISTTGNVTADSMNTGSIHYSGELNFVGVAGGTRITSDREIYVQGTIESNYELTSRRINLTSPATIESDVIRVVNSDGHGNFYLRTGTDGIQMRNTIYGAGALWFALNDNGNIGVGKVTATEKLDVDGTVKATTFSGDLLGTINTATTAVTQESRDVSTKVATTEFVDTAINGVNQSKWARNETTKVLSPNNFGDSVSIDSTTITEKALSVEANTLTTGAGLYVGSSSSGLNDKLVELNISDASATGDVLSIDNNGTGKAIDATGNITATSLTGVLTDGVTGTTQSAGDNSTKIATTAYVETAISAEDIWDRSGTDVALKNIGDDVGIGTNDPTAKLDVRGNLRVGDWTSPDVSIVGVPSSGGDFNIGQTSGSGNVKIVSNAGTDLVTIQNDGDMGIGKVPTEKLDVNGTAQATILKANNGILDSSETEGDILAITGDSLTAGTAISINSLSSSDILRNLIEVRHSGTGNSTSAIDINLGASRGSILNGYSSNTTQPGLRLDCNDLTYGAVAHFASSSPDTNIRKLVHIQNANALSTGTTGLVIDQASTGPALSTNGDIVTTGDLTAANVTVGNNLGISQSGVTNLVVGATANTSKLYFGQAINSNLVVEWTYNATPEDASARIATWGYANDFFIDAKDLVLQNHSGNNVGIGTTLPASKLHVDSNSANTVAIQRLENTAGNFDIFRSDATPESSITGSMGDLAVDSTNGNTYTKHSGNATNTGWTQLQTNPSGTYDILTAADLEALATGSIITVSSDLMLNIKTPISSTVVYVMQAGATLGITYSLGGSYTYTGSSNQFSGTGGSLKIRNGSMTASGSSATLFSNSFTSPFEVINIQGTLFSGYNGGSIIGRGSFTLDGCAFVDYRSSLVVSGHSSFKALNVNGYSATVFPAVPAFNIRRGYGGTAINIFNVGSWSLYNGSLVRFDPALGDNSKST